MGLMRGFRLQLDDHLRALFHEAPKVVIRAWAPESIEVVKHFTFEGTPSGGRKVVLAYGECGPRGHDERFCVEQGSIAIGGLALRTVRHFFEAAGSKAHIYIGVRYGIDHAIPQIEPEIRLEKIEVRMHLSTPDQDEGIEINGLGDYSVLDAYTRPSLDKWRIYPEVLEYVGLREEGGTREMPTWLEKALKE
jgi:hypothetical protein